MNLKKLFGATDMTEGSPAGKIVAFTVPMLIGNVAQQLYGTVDSIVVGRYVGDNALAAVGSASPVFNLLLVLFVGVATGAGIMVSQYYGAKDRENLSKTIGISLTLIFIVSLIISFSAIFVTKPMLRLLNTPESIIDWCAEYLYILFYGVIGLAFYNILSGILRGLGDSFSALLYLLIACILNIGLDIFFVASLGMGVAGVALATVIAQVISAVLSMLKLMRMKDIFDTGTRYLRLEKRLSLNVLRLGLPSGITQAIFSMAMLLVQSLTNSFGEAVIAANVIVMRVDGFAMMPNFSFGTAMTTFAGQNVGAGRLDRVKKGARDGTLISTATTIVLTAAILIFGRYLMRIFTETEELVTLAMKMMMILAAGYVAMSVTQCLSGVMRGAGDTMTPMWISLISTVVIRVPVAYLLAYLSKTPENPQGEPLTLFISLLASWLIGAAITVIAYRRGKWKKRSIVA
ncbi:MAG: MATE family efflux transporter [Clostridia bacterium]|nr:MATE family efflux transporter [Clostridia bacterium]